MTDEEYANMFQIGVTPEMRGVKQMSVKELRFDDGYFIVSEPLPDRVRFKIDVPYAVAELNRNQSHMLYLYLKERFEPK